MRKGVILLALLHRLGAPIPERGACSDLVDLVPEDERLLIDVEAAKDDARRH